MSPTSMRNPSSSGHLALNHPSERAHGCDRQWRLAQQCARLDAHGLDDRHHAQDQRQVGDDRSDDVAGAEVQVATGRGRGRHQQLGGAGPEPDDHRTDDDRRDPQPDGDTAGADHEVVGRVDHQAEADDQQEDGQDHSAKVTASRRRGRAWLGEPPRRSASEGFELLGGHQHLAGLGALDGPTTPRSSSRSMRRPARANPTRSLRWSIEVEPSWLSDDQLHGLDAAGRRRRRRRSSRRASRCGRTRARALVGALHRPRRTWPTSGACLRQCADDRCDLVLGDPGALDAVRRRRRRIRAAACRPCRPVARRRPGRGSPGSR